MSPALVSNNSAVDIIDIRVNGSDFSAVGAIQDGLDPPRDKPRSFPTLLLYDTVGLRLFEEITYLDEYYLTNAEIDVLETHARTIAERLPANSQLVELGSGNLRKIEILLKQFECMQKRVDYWALDLSLEELTRTFAQVSPQSYQYVQLKGLYGTYDDAIEWLKNPVNREQPTCVMSMGSSLGNFNHLAAADFLSQFAKLLGPADSMIIGLDGCKDRGKVYKAYNDSKGITRRFYINGLVHANNILGYEAFKLDQWDIECLYDEYDGCHRAFYVPTVDVSVNGILLKRGEKVLFEEAYKYDAQERVTLWHKAGLINVAALGNASDDYHLHMLSPASLEFKTRPAEYAPSSVPSWGEWRSLWTAWDIVSKTMVPRDELISKPIKLRNALIFYLGHIPTFLDIHLTRATRGKPTDPKIYPQIFERGIDPDVDNPEQCHAHSEIPDEWPALGEILEYQENVRTRVQSLLKMEKLLRDRILSEALWIGFEHEAMHLETFLYMLLQSDKILPPVGFNKPDFEKMARDATQNEKPNEWFSIPQQTFTIGLDDPDVNGVPDYSFGWDNEKPQRSVTVHAFEAQGRAVTNREYLHYMEQNDIHRIPASWVIQAANSWNGTFNGHHTDGVSSGHGNTMYNYSVRTVYGPVALVLAADWPVMASYDEMAGYAEWKNCRLPTFEEARSIYKHAAALKKEQSNGVHDSANGASNGHHVDVGSDVQLNGTQNGINPEPVFIDLSGTNVGFKNWHPIPITPNGDKLAGQSELGGVWEWTSTPLSQHDGFEAMEIYPGYTSDFFDGKHNIVLGGSWATHPRIAGRTTFVNWYQHNYPYAWTGARLVRDI
ncbi:putative N-methyltransferase [Talaromyces proteolyticus]|uniref:N-methyltransferase n=1 Tax=Talaromyces proteolyticus TaxID=1131652 RepID=A0AAD4KPY2_9EURO|nr:putative N-methyltransferase [Talaromyces proteolyticus]KAH8696526.1 putative N-methyltransferase [Talaromyces proteolyticus]